MLRAIILLIALVAGGGAAWFAAQGATPEPVAQNQPPSDMNLTAILVAARDLPRGDQVTVDALQWQEWPAEALPAISIERNARPDAVRELAGQFAARQITAGEPITTLVFSAEPSGFLAASLAPGMRAVAINVNAQSTAGGFILPNDRVDVLHMVEASREPGSDAARTRTILRSVRVLAVDQTTEETESGSVVGKTATLELTEEQVEAVTAAESSGTLSLSLRPLEPTPVQASLEIAEPARTIRVRRGTIIEEVVIN